MRKEIEKMNKQELESQIQLKIWTYNFFAVSLLKVPSKEIIDNFLDYKKIQQFEKVELKEVELLIKQLKKLKSYKNEEWIKIHENILLCLKEHEVLIFHYGNQYIRVVKIFY